MARVGRRSGCKGAVYGGVETALHLVHGHFAHALVGHDAVDRAGDKGLLGSLEPAIRVVFRRRAQTPAEPGRQDGPECHA